MEHSLNGSCIYNMTNESIKMQEVMVATEFAYVPFGRYRTDGDFSAQRFREDFLVPRLEQSDVLVVDFNGVSEAVGSSFLNESFAGLVAVENYNKDELLKKLEIRSDNDDLIKEILEYIREA